MNGSQTTLLLAIGCAVGLFARSTASPETVRELLLVDEEGRPRARLGITAGQPLLEMLDETGRKRAVLGLLPGGKGAALGLMNSSGDYPRVELRAEDPGHHGPVDFLTFRDDEPSEDLPAHHPVRTAVRLGHGSFGTGAELLLDGGDSVFLGTYPYAGISVDRKSVV